MTKWIMISGPQVSTAVFLASKPQLIEQHRHDADIAPPAFVRPVDRQPHLDALVFPGFKFVDIKHVARGASAVEQDDAAKVGPPPQHLDRSPGAAGPDQCRR